MRKGRSSGAIRPSVLGCRGFSLVDSLGVCVCVCVIPAPWGGCSSGVCRREALSSRLGVFSIVLLSLLSPAS